MDTPNDRFDIIMTELQEKYHITNALLGKKVNITGSTIGQWRERKGNKINIEIELLIYLYETYKVNPLYIITGQKPKYVDKIERPVSDIEKIFNLISEFKNKINLHLESRDQIEVLNKKVELIKNNQQILMDIVSEFVGKLQGKRCVLRDSAPGNGNTPH